MFSLIANFMPFAIVHPEIENLLVRELPKNTHPACPFARLLRCNNRHIARYAPAITP
jgi:hypothetical protein